MKKILIVDDSALVRRVLCDIINKDERFQVEDRATNGLEALELLTNKSYDAVVLDINMPKMNGTLKTAAEAQNSCKGYNGEYGYEGRRQGNDGRIGTWGN